MTFWNDVDFSMRQVPFNGTHFLFILSVFIIVFLFVWKLEYIRNKSNVFRFVFLGLSLVQVFVLYLWSGLELGFSIEAGLPIHLCRISTLMGLYFLVTLDKRVFNALFYTSFFALVAIFYPVNVHPIYTHVIGYSYQVSHILIILVWIMGVFVYGYRPTYKVMNYAILWFSLIMLFIWRFNYWVGKGEYLYIRSDVNRPFFKEWHDLLWILALLVVSYIVMLGMTYVFNRKNA